MKSHILSALALMAMTLPHAADHVVPQRAPMPIAADPGYLLLPTRPIPIASGPLEAPRLKTGQPVAVRNDTLHGLGNLEVQRSAGSQGSTAPPKPAMGPGEAPPAGYRLDRLHGNLLLSLPGYRNTSATVFGLDGRDWLTLRLRGENTALPISGLPNGAYYLALHGPSWTSVVKFLKY